jgi:hypothetical protein
MRLLISSLQVIFNALFNGQLVPRITSRTHSDKTKQTTQRWSVLFGWGEVLLMPKASKRRQQGGEITFFCRRTLAS